MLRKSLLPAVVCLLAFAGSAFPTTIIPKDFMCPICDGRFTVLGFGSYSYRLPPPRNLPLSPPAIVSTCPYCLYTAFQRDMDAELSQQVIDNVRHALATTGSLLVAKLNELAPGVDPMEVDKDVVASLIARRCYAAVDPNDDRAVSLWRYACDETWPDEPIHAACRRQAIAAMGKELETGRLKPSDQAVLAYLRAEFQRRAGQFPEAFAGFAEVRRLAGELPGPDYKDWLPTWCDEQSALAHMGTLKVAELDADLPADMATVWMLEDIAGKAREAIQELAGRKDPQAWEALLRFCQRSPWNLDFASSELNQEVLRIYPPMGQWVARQYDLAVQDKTGDAAWVKLKSRLEPLCRRYDIDYAFHPEKEWVQQQADDLLAKLKREPADAFPFGWTNEQAIALLAILVRRGEPEGVRAFALWMRHPAELDKLDRELELCFQALSERADFWPLVRQTLKAAPPEGVPDLSDCVLLVCRDEAAAVRLRDRLEEDEGRNVGDKAILKAFEVVRHPGLKASVLGLLEDEKARFPLDATAYLSAVCTDADLPRLDELAKKPAMSGWGSGVEQSVVRTIRLRSLMQSGAATRPASAADATTHASQEVE